jgi:hypothetical protein
LLAAILVVGIVKASLDSSEDTTVSADLSASATEATKPAAQPEAPRAAAKPAPVRVAAAPPAAPAVAQPPRPTADDVAACNNYAQSQRTQAGDVVKNGVLGGALGAGVGAASGAIANGGKGAGKGAGIGAVVGATAGTLYGLNKKSQDDARSEQAYRQCMAQRGF